MRNKWLIIIALIILASVIAYFIFFNNNSNNNPSSDAQRLSAEQNIENSEQKKLTETELSHFSTKIIIDDNKRDNNLDLSCEKINGTILKKGEEFSFNKVVGNPTPDEGYEKAGIIVNGKKEKGYGGGNCQVSTTLYNAALKAKLKITERHEHGKDVGYIEEGKDATVVYDELDLKFKNTTDNDVKIYASTTEKEITVKIVKLSYE